VKERNNRRGVRRNKLKGKKGTVEGVELQVREKGYRKESRCLRSRNELGMET
jgi:hypothetical protein